jgi:hypothetical protein
MRIIPGITQTDNTSLVVQKYSNTGIKVKGDFLIAGGESIKIPGGFLIYQPRDIEPTTFYYLYADSKGIFHSQNPSIKFKTKVGAFYTNLEKNIIFAISKGDRIPKMTAEILWTYGQNTSTGNAYGVLDYQFTDHYNPKNGIFKFFEDLRINSTNARDGSFIALAPIVINYGNRGQNIGGSEQYVVAKVMKHGVSYASEYTINWDAQENNRNYGVFGSVKLEPDEWFKNLARRTSDVDGSLTVKLALNLELDWT